MSIALITSLLLAYSGMLGLCLGLERHYKQLSQRPPSKTLRHTLRTAGWLALAGSFFTSAQVWGWAMGPVGWLGLVSMTGLALVLLLPYAIRLAVGVSGAGWLVLGVFTLSA
ncbi:DUF3325 domain-containing protein [Pseudomonas cichorii]|uniref:DUF3325 domain-containing protein n=1 Tax=Pseudomonas cichorii TaxID=36746 RepID=UPI001C8A1305|nr:DUF3325 domain-containing protein [Pseudomonas cichorii]MBX8513170.1 DUF3325 domain-containing protein [Pseudomonas cichorii]